MNQPMFKLTADVLRTRETFVADAIRTAILHGVFKPGDKLDQQQMADELLVSRSPVREALYTLRAEGLVTIIPNRGAIVTERSLSELEELYFIRKVLEGAAAERAAPQLTDKRQAQLAAILERADGTNDFEELLVLNNEFHMAVYTAFPQLILVSYIQQLRNLFGPYNRLYLDQAGSKEAAWSDHRKIYDACVRRDGELARIETQNHLEQVFKRIVNGVKEH
jgi:DNA-binding GntR family transcriptional regulator